jgi:hypothetical protein
VSPLLSGRTAIPLFLGGAALLVADLNGPQTDWFAHLGVNLLHMDYTTLALGIQRA